MTLVEKVQKIKDRFRRDDDKEVYLNALIEVREVLNRGHERDSVDYLINTACNLGDYLMKRYKGHKDIPIEYLFWELGCKEKEHKIYRAYGPLVDKDAFIRICLFVLLGRGTMPPVVDRRGMYRLTGNGVNVILHKDAISDKIGISPRSVSTYATTGQVKCGYVISTLDQRIRHE